MRALTRLVVTVVVLAVLALLADTGTRTLAQSRLAAQVQASQGLTATPDVTIGGFPFLTQAADGVYQDITVSSDALPGAQSGAQSGARSVAIVSVEARFRGVHVPLTELLQGTVSTVPVDRIDATAVVGYSALAQALVAGSDGRLSALTITGPSGSSSGGSGGSPQTVTVRGTFAVGPLKVAFDAPLTVTLSRNQVRLEVKESGLSGLDAPVRQALVRSGALALTLTLPALPYGLVVDRLTTGPDGIAVAAHATNVTLSRSAG